LFNFSLSSLTSNLAQLPQMDVYSLTIYRKQAKVGSIRSRKYIQTGILPYFSGFSLDLFPRTDAFLLFIKTYPVHMKTCKRPFYQHFSISYVEAVDIHSEHSGPIASD
jgi:hypothetical protein